MGSKLCCTGEQDDRSSSPCLPNARVSDATPAKRPLLHPPVGSQGSHSSPGSHFTSARSEDLHELRQIFDNAKDTGSDGSSPVPPKPLRYSRPSIYSLHSLRRMKSVQVLLKGRRSKDLPKTATSSHPNLEAARTDAASRGPETVVRNPKFGPNAQLKITKSDLRKDLLSDKAPAEGGYDSDAEVLDDIAKKIGKKSPSKRPSLQSIDWTPSPGRSSSKQTSDTAGDYYSTEQEPPRRHYTLKVKGHHLIGASHRPGRFNTVFSSPNLGLHTPPKKDRKLRRSHSDTSAEHPAPSPLTLLPSIKPDETEEVPWGVSMQECFRLSRFQVSPMQLNFKASKSSLIPKQTSTESNNAKEIYRLEPPKAAATEIPQDYLASLSEPPKLQFHVQEPTASPRISISAKENATPEVAGDKETLRNEIEDEYPRSSVHLHNMRISHHLRSGSTLSWQHFADAPPLPPPPPIFRDRNVSDQSHKKSASRSRHNRQTSSSGFASSKVPSKWGKVVASSQYREEMSSIYSSRPHSPPESFGGSHINLPYGGPDSSTTIVRNLASSPSDSAPTDNEETPKPAKRYGSTNFEAARKASVTESFLNPSAPVRNNSVAHTKKSKFREEFSPTPPRKKYNPTLSIMNILRPLNIMRSQSDTNLNSKKNTDGPADPSHSPNKLGRESLASIQKEQRALGKDKAASPMWDRALKAHQEELSSLLLPGNKGLATQGSLARQRSGSTIARPKSTNNSSPLANNRHDADAWPTATTSHTPTIDEDDDLGPSFQPGLIRRRTALIPTQEHADNPAHEIQIAFDRQTDTPEIVGAWGRYPSHTRPDRTSSAGHLDSVKTRDFALEQAVRSAELDEEEEIDPIVRPETPPSSGGKRRKKRVGSGRMAKSNSMTFGKTFIKNYTRIFRSQSTEFQRHGYGHRSSIAAGGTLKYPELEMVPPAWSGVIAEEDPGRGKERLKEEPANHNRQPPRVSPTNFRRASIFDNTESRTNFRRASIFDNTDPRTHFRRASIFGMGNLDKDKNDEKGKQRADDSSSTLRPPNSTLRPQAQYTLDGVIDEVMARPPDRARVWSIYYEDCVPSFPKPSMDGEPRSLSYGNLNDVLELEEFGGASSQRPRTGGRLSFDSRRNSMHSRTLPTRLKSHTSLSYRKSHSHHQRLSRASIASRGSIVPSFVSLDGVPDMGDGADTGMMDDQRSVFSVRRSTLDLISMFREQEIVERERVLGMLRVDSMRGGAQVMEAAF